MNNGRSSRAAHQRGGAAESNSRSKEHPEEDPRLRSTKYVRRIPYDPRTEHGGATERSEPAHERCGPALERREPAREQCGATEPKARDYDRIRSPQRTVPNPRVSAKVVDNGRSNHDECKRGGDIQRPEAKTRLHSAKSTSPTPHAPRHECPTTLRAKSIVQKAITEAKPGGHPTRNTARREANEAREAFSEKTLRCGMRTATAARGRTEHADTVVPTTHFHRRWRGASSEERESDRASSEQREFRADSQSHKETSAVRAATAARSRTEHTDTVVHATESQEEVPRDASQAPSRSASPRHRSARPRPCTDMERTGSNRAIIEPTTGSSGRAEHVDTVVHARSCHAARSEQEVCDASESQEVCDASESQEVSAEEQEVCDASESQSETSEASEASDSPLPSTSVDRLTRENIERAYDWDSDQTQRAYTKKEFRQRHCTHWWQEWQTAKHATDEATAAVKRISQDRRTATAIKQMIRRQMTDDEDWLSAIVRAFYVALRWRAEYLQQNGRRLRVTSDGWAGYNLSPEREGTHQHVRRFIRDWHHISITHQHASKRKQKSVVEYVCNRFSKSIHLARSLINTGVHSNEWITGIQQSHQKWTETHREEMNTFRSRSPRRRHRPSS